MRALVIENGVVTNAVEANALDALPGVTLIDGTSGGEIGWLWNGSALSAPPPPVKSAQQLQGEIVAATQARLDGFARATFTDAQGRVHGDYDDVNAAAKYASLADAQIAAMPAAMQPQVTMFRTDCQYLQAVTAQTWATLWATLAQVQAGNWPTAGAAQTPGGYADIEPSLPALAWPA